jgi:hypothetical protein
MEQTQTFEIEIAGEVHTFAYRPVESMAAITMLARIAPMLESFRAAKANSTEDGIRAAQEIAHAVAPDEATAQSAMRTMLRGPHERIEWYYDVPWQAIMVVVTNWIAHKYADLAGEASDA